MRAFARLTSVRSVLGCRSASPDDETSLLEPVDPLISLLRFFFLIFNGLIFRPGLPCLIVLVGDGGPDFGDGV